MASLPSLRHLRPSDLERLADALERRATAAAPTRPTTDPDSAALPVDPSPVPRREDLYGEARRHFASRERELRDTAQVTERVLGQLRRELPAAPQQLLLLRAPIGGVAGGRVRVRNAATTEARFAFRPRFDLPVRFSPARFSLPPGESRVVDVRVELLGHPGHPGERTTLAVDVLADGRAALKLWLEIEFDRPPDTP